MTKTVRVGLICLLLVAVVRAAIPVRAELARPDTRTIAHVLNRIEFSTEREAFPG